MAREQDRQLKECDICGSPFEAVHGNKRLCDECLGFIRHNQGVARSIVYSNPGDIEAYERGLRRRNIENHRDTIIAEGYADRQRAKTLAGVEKIKTTL